MNGVVQSQDALESCGTLSFLSLVDIFGMKENLYCGRNKNQVPYGRGPHNNMIGESSSELAKGSRALCRAFAL